MSVDFRSLQRTDGVPHAAIVNSLIKNVLPNVVNFDQTRVGLVSSFSELFK